MSDLPDVSPGPAPLTPPALPKQRRQSRHRPRRLAVLLLTVLGLGGVAGGGTGLFLELSRAPTRAEVSAAVRQEIASRWRRLPAGQIFPATVSYLTADNLRAKAYREGIAPAASCSAALDPAAARLLRREGCTVVLRATYADSSGTVASTVGIAVMPGAGAAAAAATRFAAKSQHAGVKAVAFPGTVTRLFGNPERVWFYAAPLGPYIFFSTAGYTSGPYAHRRGGPSTFSDLGLGFSGQEMTVLTRAVNPCQRKDIRC